MSAPCLDGLRCRKSTVRVALKTMRWGSLLMLSLLLGATPAPAQDSPGSYRRPSSRREAATKHRKAESRRRKTGAPKAADAKSEPASPEPPSQELVEVGWTIVTDRPPAFSSACPQDGAAAREAAARTRWSRPRARCRSRLSASPTRPQARGAVRAGKEGGATRKVETSVLTRRRFLISGQQGLKRFSVRAKDPRRPRCAASPCCTTR